MKTRFFLLLALLALLWPARAAAHANLVRSTPAANAVVAAAPPTVELFFSEPLETASLARVVNAQGQTVDKGDSRINPADPNGLLVGLPQLPNGVYTVQWLTVSAADGHSSKGTVAFAVGDASAAQAPLLLPPAVANPLALPPPELTLLRWLTIVALTLLGGALTWRWLLGTILDTAPTLPKLGRWQRWLVAGAAALGLAATAVALAQTLGAGAALLTSRSAAILAARLALLTLTAALAWASIARPRLLGGALVSWAAAALTVSLLGHSAVNSAATGYTALAVALDWLHIAATAAWIGGLAQLLLMLVALRRLETATRWALLGQVLPRFSRLALGCVLVLSASGLYSAWKHVGTLDNLWTTAYGITLLIKLGLFAVLLALGALNQQALLPGLDAAEGSDLAVRRLRRSVGVELGVGALVLLLVGSLTSLPPARELPRATSYITYVTAADLDLTFQIMPEPSGQYVVAVTVDGLPAGAAPTRVLLRSSMASHNMAADEIELQQVESNRWGARGSFLSMTGVWQYEIIVRTPGRDDIVQRLDVDSQRVDAAVLAPLPLLQRLSLPTSMLVAFAMLAGALLVGAGGSWSANGWPRGRWKLATNLLVVGSFLSCVVPYYLQQALTPRNPYGPTPEVLAAGRTIYQSNCVPCHGVAGRGDGPAARSLRVPPANFTLPHYTTHPEALLYDWVANGIPGRGMPAWGQQLSKQQIWQVLTYIGDLNRQALTPQSSAK